MVKIHFDVVPHLVKYLNFGQKLLIRTTHQTFIERRHPDVTKNPCYVFPPSGAKKGSRLKLVSQGSILRPLLFLIFVNVLNNSTKVLDPVLFADNTNLFCSDNKNRGDLMIGFLQINYP